MGLPTKGAGSPSISWTYEGDVTEAAKWLPYAVGMLRAYANKGLPKGNSTPEIGVDINFDAMTGRIHIRAGGDAPYLIMVHPDSVGDRAGFIPSGSENSVTSPYNYKTRVRYKKVAAGMLTAPHYFNDPTIIKDDYYAGDRYWVNDKDVVSWRKAYVYTKGLYHNVPLGTGVGCAMVATPAQTAAINSVNVIKASKYIIVANSLLTIADSITFPGALYIASYGHNGTPYDLAIPSTPAHYPGQLQVVNSASTFMPSPISNYKNSILQLFTKKGDKLVFGYNSNVTSSNGVQSGGSFDLGYYNVLMPEVGINNFVRLASQTSLLTWFFPVVSGTASQTVVNNSAGYNADVQSTISDTHHMSAGGKYFVYGDSVRGASASAERFYFLYAEPSKLDASDVNSYHYTSVVTQFENGAVTPYQPRIIVSDEGRTHVVSEDTSIGIKLGYINLETKEVVYSVFVVDTILGQLNSTDHKTDNHTTEDYPLLYFQNGNYTATFDSADSKRTFVLLGADFSAQVFVWAVYDITTVVAQQASDSYSYNGFVTTRTKSMTSTTTVTTTTTVKVRSPAGVATLDTFSRETSTTETTTNFPETIGGVPTGGDISNPYTNIIQTIIPAPLITDVHVWGFDPVVSSAVNSLRVGIKNAPNFASNGKYLTCKYFAQRGNDNAYTMCIDTIDIQNAATRIPTRVLAEHTLTSGQTSKITDHAISLTM